MEGKDAGCWKKEHHGGSNTRDYQFGEHSFSSSTQPLLWHSLPLTEANIHLRSSISNVPGPLLAQGYGTKVYFPFLSSTLSPSLLMNITDWFTEKLKTLAAGIHSNLLWFLRRMTVLKENVFFYKTFTFWSVHPLIVQLGNEMPHVAILSVWGSCGHSLFLVHL